MPDLNRKQTVALKWSYPQKLENFKSSHFNDMMGIYIITRKFSNKQSIIYVGKTKWFVTRRLYEHENRDFSPWTEKKGVKYVRFARVQKDGFDDELLLDCVESAIIQSLIEDGVYTLTNKDKIKTCTAYYELRIKSIGFPFILNRDIDFVPDGD